jgi:hypothetical protein
MTEHDPSSGPFVSGTSLESFEEAVTSAMGDIRGDPNREGIAYGEVTRLWVEKGGIVGRPQYHATVRELHEPPRD